MKRFLFTHESDSLGVHWSRIESSPVIVKKLGLSVDMDLWIKKTPVYREKLNLVYCDRKWKHLYDTVAGLDRNKFRGSQKQEKTKNKTKNVAEAPTEKCSLKIFFKFPASKLCLLLDFFLPWTSMQPLPELQVTHPTGPWFNARKN